METGKKIYCNGKIVDLNNNQFDVASLLRSPYVYAAVNTDAHRPIYTERHLTFAAASYEKLYGTRPCLDTAAISRQISGLLRENRLPLTGSVVTVYLIPHLRESGPPQPSVIIITGMATIYHGYELAGIRPRAVITNYEIPFSGHRTAVSLATSEYMASFALGSGAGLSLRANRSGNIISSGDYPVFAVKEGVVLTPYVQSGAGENLERELMLEVCRLAGIETRESDLPVVKLSQMEELMVFGPCGIQSVLACGEAYFYNLTALELAKHLRQITEQGLH